MERPAYARCSDEHLRRMYGLWLRGTLSKVEIERKFFNDVRSQAKAITGAWRDRLGIETEGRSRLALRCEELEQLLQDELLLAAKKFRDTGHTLLAHRFEARAKELK